MPPAQVCQRARQRLRQQAAGQASSRAGRASAGGCSSGAVTDAPQAPQRPKQREGTQAFSGRLAAAAARVGGHSPAAGRACLARSSRAAGPASPPSPTAAAGCAARLGRRAPPCSTGQAASAAQGEGGPSAAGCWSPAADACCLPVFVDSISWELLPAGSAVPPGAYAVRLLQRHLELRPRVHAKNLQAPASRPASQPQTAV